MIGIVNPHDALPIPPKARRAVLILVLVIFLTYFVGMLGGYGDAVAVAVATAVVGVVAERLTRLLLRYWVRVV